MRFDERNRTFQGGTVMPLREHVDPEVYALISQVRGLVDQAKDLVIDIDETVEQLEAFSRAADSRSRREDDDAGP